MQGWMGGGVGWSHIRDPSQSPLENSVSAFLGRDKVLFWTHRVVYPSNDSPQWV